ncbi:MAG: hypothetical protein GY832_18715 [Chloroflexi bacterium]|nr:hypothetical protein [Chloroflexota bacterium]
MATVIQSVEYSLRPLTDPLCLLLDQTNRYGFPIQKGCKTSSPANRQAQFEPAQADQATHLLPPGASSFCLSLLFRRRQFVTAVGATPTLDENML